jgi:hypothetical protein
MLNEDVLVDRIVAKVLRGLGVGSKSNSRPPVMVTEQSVDNRDASLKLKRRPNETAEEFWHRCALLDREEGRVVWESDLRKAADDERRNRPLPRSPEQCRGWRW